MNHLAFFALLILAGCSKSKVEEVPTSFRAFSILKNPSESTPEALQQASKAVVRIETIFGGGTGSYISEEGHLLTNNHVLGTESCLREGCYGTVHFFDEMNPQEPRYSTEVFFKPIVISPQADAVVFQTFSVQDGRPHEVLAPKAFLSHSRKPVSHEGEAIYAIGHPNLGLKKWTSGNTKGTQGQWILGSYFSLPGSSGSPILNRDGELIGLHHRSCSSKGCTTRWGEVSSATFSPLESFLTKEGQTFSLDTSVGLELLSSRQDSSSPVTRKTVLRSMISRQPSLLNARGEDTSLTDALAELCDQALARDHFHSLDDVKDDVYYHCSRYPFATIQCDPALKKPFQVCPEDAEAWAQRWRKAGALLRDFNAPESWILWTNTFPIGQFGTDRSKRHDLRKNAFEEFLDDDPEYSFNIAYYLARFVEGPSNPGTYKGVKVKKFLDQYNSQPGFENFLPRIAYAYTWLYETPEEKRKFLQSLMGEPAMSLAQFLEIEAEIHRSYD